MPVWEEGRWMGLQPAQCTTLAIPPRQVSQPLSFVDPPKVFASVASFFVPRRFVEAGGTHVPLAARVLVRPEVIFWRPRARRTARSQWSTSHL